MKTNTKLRRLLIETEAELIKLNETEDYCEYEYRRLQDKLSNIGRILINIQKVGMTKSVAKDAREVLIKELPKEYYSPSESLEHYDYITQRYYNRNGGALRNPSEYDQRSEGYTPFGDE